MSLKSYTQIVGECLQNIPGTRDDDIRLYYVVLSKKNISLDGITGGQLLKMIHERLIPSPQLITRIRAKLQEHNANLRGESWEKRHKIGNRIRQQIIRQ